MTTIIITIMFAKPFQLVASLENSILVSYYSTFIDKQMSEKIFNLFETNIVYNTDEQSQVVIMGKKINIPRKQVAFGDPNIKYTFSGTTVKANDWNENNKLCEYIRYIRDKVSKRFHCDFNYVLINKYETGDQYIGFHSDDEKDLDLDSPIVGVSFGSTREITFKHKEKNITKKLVLSNGSAYCMHYPTNKKWKHAILKGKNIYCPRISLTFRKMK